MTNPAYEGAVGCHGERFQGGIAHIPFGARHADLDQLVVVQRALGFSYNARRDAGVADENQGFEWVGEAFEVPPLLVIELHAPIVRNVRRSVPWVGAQVGAQVGATVGAPGCGD